MSPEAAWSLVVLAMILLMGLCVLLAYMLGYRNGEAAKIAHVLESVLEGIEKRDATEQRDPEK